MSRLELRHRICAVLFDLDNTLHPEFEYVKSGFRAVARHLERLYGMPAEGLGERMLAIVQEQGRGKVFDTLLSELHLEEKGLIRELLHVYRSHEPAIELYPGVDEGLRKLRSQGVALGLITDGTAPVQIRKIHALGLEPMVDAIICTDELGKGLGKPSVVPFNLALRYLGVRPEAALYVGDDAGKDFLGPARLNMGTLQIRNPLLNVRSDARSESYHPADRTFDSIGECLAHLSDLCREEKPEWIPSRKKPPMAARV